MSQLSRGFENLADWRALARIGLGGIDLYCRSFVRPPQCIILDIDDIDDPSKNSPWCAVTATTAEPALLLPRAMCRDYTLGFARHNLHPRRDDTHGRADVRFIITNLRRAWQGALREVFWPHERNLIEDMECLTRSPPARGGRQTSFPHIGSNWLLHSLRRAAPKRSRRLQPPSRRSGSRS
jgi:hypothetical protein